MTPTWIEALSTKTSDEWLYYISSGIPADVKKLLGGLRPPTYKKLANLSFISTIYARVYARLVESCFKTQIPSDRYVYVGSASRYNKELAGGLHNTPGGEKVTMNQGYKET